MTESHRAAEIMAAECLLFRARRLTRVLTRLYDEALRPLGLRANQLTLLNAITLFGAEGAPMSRLAEVLSMDLTTLSRNVPPLQKDGPLRIERMSTDRRTRLVRLTSSGERRVSEALHHWERAQRRVVAVLGEEAAASLREGFDAAVMAAAGESAVS